MYVSWFMCRPQTANSSDMVSVLFMHSFFFKRMITNRGFWLQKQLLKSKGKVRLVLWAPAVQQQAAEILSKSSAGKEKTWAEQSDKCQRVLGHLWDPEAMEVNFVELNRQTVFGQPVACFVRTSNINELTTKNKMVNWNKSILPLGCNTPHDSVSAATTQPPHTSYISCMTMHSSCCISACRDINSLMHISGGSLRFSGFKLLNRVISWFWQAPNKAHRSWSAGKQGSIYQTAHPIRAYKPIIKLFFLNSGLQDCK